MGLEEISVVCLDLEGEEGPVTVEGSRRRRRVVIVAALEPCESARQSARAKAGCVDKRTYEISTLFLETADLQLPSNASQRHPIGRVHQTAQANGNEPVGAIGLGE